VHSLLILKECLSAAALLHLLPLRSATTSLLLVACKEDVSRVDRCRYMTLLITYLFGLFVLEL
jgi:hypothetical protein